MLIIQGKICCVYAKQGCNWMGDLHLLSVHIQQCHSEISRMFCSYCTVRVYTPKKIRLCTLLWISSTSKKTKQFTIDLAYFHSPLDCC